MASNAARFRRAKRTAAGGPVRRGVYPLVLPAAPASRSTSDSVIRLALTTVPLWLALALPSLLLPVGWSLADTARLLVLDAGLASALVGLALLLGTLARPLVVLAALGLGAVVTWHLREITLAPDSAATFAAWSLLTGVSLAAWLRVWARDTSARAGGAMIAIGATAAALVLVVAYPQSETFRHHLLRHHTTVGTALYYAFEPRLEDAYAEQREPSSEPRPVSAPASLRGARARPDAPNIVFVVVDTLRADRLDKAWMPETRAWAESGLLFTDVVANASWTRPSVASLFTGLRPETHGAVDQADHLSPEISTLAEELAAGGYDTVAFVTNFGAVGAEFGFDQGFAEFFEIDGTPEHRTARAADVKDRIDGWLSKRSHARPLFLYAHFLDPHDPYFGFSPSRLRSRVREAYAGELEYFDGEFTQLRKRIAEQLGPNTIVIFTSDHGEALGEHGMLGHGSSLYPEQADIPLAVVGPGLSPGQSDARLEGHDLFDLTLALAFDSDLDLPAWAASRDRSNRFSSVYTHLPAGPHRPFQRINASRRLDEDEFVLIWSAYGNTYELYDQSHDPDFRNNLADAHPEIVDRLRRQMAKRRPVRRPTEAAEPSEKAKEQLRALGYVE